MKITDEQKEIIINCGMFEYSPERISNVLGIDLDIILKEINDEDSEFNEYLKIGRDRGDYVIDLKLFEMAKIGDLKALSELQARKYNRKSE